MSRALRFFVLAAFLSGSAFADDRCPRKLVKLTQKPNWTREIAMAGAILGGLGYFAYRAMPPLWQAPVKEIREPVETLETPEWKDDEGASAIPLPTEDSIDGSRTELLPSTYNPER